ncbi:ABC transporter ATP-binding protein [Caulobacter segnis]|uniref:ATP-binding cassette domain-containing protein n=1 Tax=Caulobacter segnis TaxID=88688 RepID=UPI00240F1FA7|nr:ABC transporter ATP-binding protein [Caulobacter segnis]MDG2520531.1 ABC transporter ATP-binding protein [Caulobacter segnis]
MLVGAAAAAWRAATIKDRARIMLGASAIVASSVLASAAPLQLKRLVDALGPGGRMADLAPLLAAGAAYPALRLGAGLAGMVRSVALVPFAEAVRRCLVCEAASRVIDGDAAVGDAPPRVIKAIERAGAAVGLIFQSMIVSLAPLMIESVMLSVIIWRVLDPAVGALMLVVAGFYGFVAVVVTQRAVAARRRLNLADAAFTQFLFDAVDKSDAVRGVSARRWAIQRIGRLSSVRAGRAIRAQTRSSSLNAVWVLLSACAHAAALVYCVRQVHAGKMTLGDMVLVEASVLQLLAPLGAFGFIFRDVRNAFSDLQHIEGFPQRPVSQCAPVARKPAAVAIIGGVVRDEAGNVRLEGLDLAIAPGERVAVIGESGSGKSTLCRVLAGSVRLAGGAVLTDGRPTDARDLIARCGYLPQRNAMFGIGVRRNMLLGSSPSFCDRRMEALVELSAKFGVTTGKSGGDLSGGQGRLVMLARLVCRKHSFWVLDEPTAGLNPAAEAAVIAWMRRFRRHETIIMATHSLALASAADRIILLRAGRISDQGPARRMLAGHGAARRFWAVSGATSSGDEGSGR